VGSTMTSELEISPALTILAPNGSLRSLELLAVVRACMVQIEGQWTQDQDPGHFDGTDSEDSTFLPPIDVDEYEKRSTVSPHRLSFRHTPPSCRSTSTPGRGHWA